MKVVRLSTLRTDRLYTPPPQEIYLVLTSIRDSVNSAAGRIMSMKNSNNTVGNRNRDLPVCRAVPQPTAPPRALLFLRAENFKPTEIKQESNLSVTGIELHC